MHAMDVFLHASLEQKSLMSMDTILMDTIGQKSLMSMDTILMDTIVNDDGEVKNKEVSCQAKKYCTQVSFQTYEANLEVTYFKKIKLACVEKFEVVSALWIHT